ASTPASAAAQVPLQASAPDAHAQTPAWQVCPAEQGMPQPPQFAGPAVTSMQSGPQAACPAGQTGAGPAGRPLEPARPMTATAAVASEARRGFIADGFAAGDRWPSRRAR